MILCGRFECGVFQDSDIFTSRPMLSAVKAASNGSGSELVCLRSIMNWLERVLSALDCYSWTFGQNLLNPSQLLIGQLISHDMPTCRFVSMSVC